MVMVLVDCFFYGLLFRQKLLKSMENLVILFISLLHILRLNSINSNHYFKLVKMKMQSSGSFKIKQTLERLAKP